MMYNSDCLCIAYREDVQEKWKQSHKRGLIPESAWREKIRMLEYTKDKYMGDTVECLMGSSYMKIDDCIARHKTVQT